jgi:hypothetical protein
VKPIAANSRSSVAAASSVLTGLLTFFIRLIALMVFILMSLAEPFLAVVLSALALGCFVVSVLFGFILHAPFPHRWFVLGVSVVLMLAYVLYRFLMQGVQSLLR